MESLLSILDVVWKVIFIVFFFGFCIFIHEFGHMLAALWQGLYVERFSIGLGNPICRLFTWRGLCDKLDPIRRICRASAA